MATEHLIAIRALPKFGDALNRQQRAWLNAIGGQSIPGWEPPQELALKLQRALHSVGVDAADPADIAKRCRSITRGAYLISSAIDWNKPTVGRISPSAVSRGDQWRLTIAWGGTDALINATAGGLAAKHLLKATEFAPDIIKSMSLPPPNAALKGLKEARSWPVTNGQPGLIDFLGTGKGFSTEMLKRWLVEGKRLKHPTELLGLTQALRHSTAHGALSSSAVRSWGIQSAIPILLTVIAGTACGIMHRLLSELQDG